jgi:hypothetical protein
MFQVKSSNVTDIVFRQTGYLATVVVSHDLELRREKSGLQLENVKLQKVCSAN